MPQPKPVPIRDGSAILDAIKTRYNIKTDAELARFIDVSRFSINQYRHRPARVDISKRIISLLLNDIASS